MKVQLKVNSKVIQFEGPQCLIGRHGGHLRLDDMLCSRQHAILYQGYDNRLRVKDLHSTNGTVVAGEMVTYKALKPGDVVRVGDTTIEVLGFEASASKTAYASQWETAEEDLPGNFEESDDESTVVMFRTFY